MASSRYQLLALFYHATPGFQEHSAKQKASFPDGKEAQHAPSGRHISVTLDQKLRFTVTAQVRGSPGAPALVPIGPKLAVIDVK